MDHEEREEREALLQRVSSNTIASSTLDTCPIGLSNQTIKSVSHEICLLHAGSGHVFCQAPHHPRPGLLQGSLSSTHKV